MSSEREWIIAFPFGTPGPGQVIGTCNADIIEMLESELRKVSDLDEMNAHAFSDQEAMFER